MSLATENERRSGSPVAFVELFDAGGHDFREEHIALRRRGEMRDLRRCVACFLNRHYQMLRGPPILVRSCANRYDCGLSFGSEASLRAAGCKSLAQRRHCMGIECGALRLSRQRTSPSKEESSIRAPQFAGCHHMWESMVLQCYFATQLFKHSTITGPR